MNIYVASALLTLVGLAGIALILDFVLRGRSLPIGDRIAAQFGARTPQPWRWRTLNPLRYLSPKSVRAARYSTINTRASSPHIAMRDKKIAAMLAAAGLETSVAEHKQHRLVASIVTAGAAGTIFIALSTRQNIQPVAAAIAVIASAVARSVPRTAHRPGIFNPNGAHGSARRSVRSGRKLPDHDAHRPTT